MKYHITQGELCEAVQLYLNERVLKRPVKITKVEKADAKHYGIELETVTAEDDQEQVAADAREAATA